MALYMDIYTLRDETGVTLEADRFRMQDNTWIEARDESGEWFTVATYRLDQWWIRPDWVVGQVRSGTDMDVSSVASGLFPIVKVERSE